MGCCRLARTPTRRRGELGVIWPSVLMPSRVNLGPHLTVCLAPLLKHLERRNARCVAHRPGPKAVSVLRALAFARPAHRQRAVFGLACFGVAHVSSSRSQHRVHFVAAIAQARGPLSNTRAVIRRWTAAVCSRDGRHKCCAKCAVDQNPVLFTRVRVR